MAKSNLIDLIKDDPDVQYFIELRPGCHFVEVPINRLEIHRETLKKARGDDPQDVDLLKSSFEVTGGGPLYAPVIFPEKQSDGTVKLFTVDGHQRIRAEKEKCKDKIVVQVVTLWRSINEAFEVSISANFARYAVGEKDVFSILATECVGKDRLIQLSGFSASKIERLMLISRHPALVPLVLEDLVGASIMVKLIGACNKNPDKLAALTNALVQRRLEARKTAKEWRDRIKVNKHLKFEKRDKDKRNPKTYFRNLNWDGWLDALQDDLGDGDRIIKREDGTYFLKPDATVDAKCVNIRFGDEGEWEECVALFGLSGTKISEIDPSQLKDEILDNWDDIGKRIQRIYEELAPAKAKTSRKGRATSSPRKSLPSPKKQKPDMKVVSTDDDFDG